MDRAFRNVAIAVFAIYILIQILSFSLQGKSDLGIIERSIVRIASPLQNFGRGLIDGLTEAIDHYVLLVGISKRHDSMVKQLSAVKAENTRLLEIESENQRLKSLLQLGEVQELPILAARRVAMGSSPYQRTVRIDKGLADGIKKGMAVTHSQGAVGQVIQVMYSVSEVLLLTDKVSAVDVINSRTRDRALLRGHTLNSLRFEFLPEETDIRKGDLLITSGLDGVFPKGLPVAQVSEIGEKQKQLFLEAYARPHVKFQNLEEVGLVTPLSYEE